MAEPITGELQDLLREVEALVGQLRGGGKLDVATLVHVVMLLEQNLAAVAGMDGETWNTARLLERLREAVQLHQQSKGEGGTLLPKLCVERLVPQLLRFLPSELQRAPNSLIGRTLVFCPIVTMLLLGVLFAPHVVFQRQSSQTVIQIADSKVRERTCVCM